MAKFIGAIYGSWTGIAFFGAASKFTNHASEKVLRGGYIFPQSGQSKTAIPYYNTGIGMDIIKKLQILVVVLRLTYAIVFTIEARPQYANTKLSNPD